jgi:AraC-like DNA-binding protein/ligand-binding sensor protein
MAASNPACAACLRMQNRFETEAATEPKSFECFSGLTESAAPVRLGNTLLGHLQTGQVLLHRPTAKRFEGIKKKIAEMGADVDLPALERAYFSTRVLARKHYDSIVRLVNIFAQHLGVVSNQLVIKNETAEPPVVKRARAFVAEHLDEPLSLSRVAKATHMSPFYFCKIFRKSTGVTLTEYVARQRVEQVKQDLLNPHVRVSESAFARGFQSLSQFNRVFRRLAGESPSAYRNRLHGRKSAAETTPMLDSEPLLAAA